MSTDAKHDVEVAIVYRARLRARLRGHCVEAPWLALSARALRPLAEDQKPGGAGGSPT